jgi:hypothetical protein
MKPKFSSRKKKKIIEDIKSGINPSEAIEETIKNGIEANVKIQKLQLKQTRNLDLKY